MKIITAYKLIGGRHIAGRYYSRSLATLADRWEWHRREDRA